MAFLIDTIDSSGLFAQSANSATIATKDSNGNDITATYQPVGDYYSASNPSGFITGVPNTYLQNTDLSVTDGKITGISGVPISAGGSSEISSYDLSAGANINITKDDANSAIGIEVTGLSAYQPSGDYYSASNPSGFISELPASATDAISAVTSYSGAWGGSALPISAGPGIKLEIANNTLVASTDETVLYSGTTAAKQPQSAVTLSEPATNFEKLDILYWDRYLNISDSKTVYTSNMGFNNENYSRVNLEAPFLHDSTSPMYMRASQYKFSNNTTMTYESNNLIMITPSGIKSTYSTTPDNGGTYIYKVVGINRISGGN